MHRWKQQKQQQLDMLTLLLCSHDDLSKSSGQLLKVTEHKLNFLFCNPLTKLCQFIWKSVLF